MNPSENNGFILWNRMSFERNTYNDTSTGKWIKIYSKNSSVYHGFSFDMSVIKIKWELRSHFDWDENGWLCFSDTILSYRSATQSYLNSH